MKSTPIASRAIERALRPLQERGAREAFLHTLRAVIDPIGQRVAADDRLYLLADMPTLLVWGERDRTIPPKHGLAAAEAIPGARFALLPGVAHFPHLEDPEALAEVLHDFLSTTEPADYDDGRLQQMISLRSLDPMPR